MNLGSSKQFILDPFPDELLFSMMSRTFHLLEWEKSGQVLNRYMGHHSIKPTNTYHLMQFENPVVVFEHSTFPYYMSFLSLDRQQKILSHLFNPKEEKKFTGTMKFGPGNTFKKEGLYYCPLCLNDDYDNFGFPYFHLTHQYQGIFACPVHEVRLIKKNCKTKNSFPILFLDDFQEPEMASNREILYSKWAEQMGNYSLEYLKAVYHKKMIEKDSSLLNRSSLYEAFVDYYGKEFLEQNGCLIKDRANRNEKIRNLANLSNQPVHPFYHMMLWEYLELTPEDFTEPINVMRGKFHYLPVGVNLRECLLLEMSLGRKKYYSPEYNKYFLQFYPPNLKEHIEVLLGTPNIN